MKRVMAERTHRQRVLIVDDDRILLRSTQQLLDRQGYAVAVAQSVEEARPALADGAADIVLMESGLPGVRVAELLRDWKRQFPHVVWVVLTGYGTIEGAVESLRAGALDYLTKPVSDDELRLVVEKAAAQQALLCENRALREQLDVRFGLEAFVGRDHQMGRVFDLVEAVADSRTTVLIVGESGTGKSTLARAIHRRSARRDKPLVEVSCGSLPDALLESELFGHVKGAFTGAVTDRPGRFLAADGGTIFLDEINSAPPHMQVKLLRVLQERTFEPVGSTQTRTLDTRVILATNAELEPLVKSGAFRQDLYYRVNVVTIRLPPLRQRLGDVALLAERFLQQFRGETRRAVLGFSDEAIAALQRYDWPGNVRELENAVERAVILCRRPRIELDDLPEAITTPPRPRIITDDEVAARPVTLEEALRGPERRIIESALRRNAWNRLATARELGIDRTTLYKKMIRLQIVAADAA